MNLTDLYSEYFANWISGGNLIARDKISLLGIRPLYDRYVTNSYITKVWCVIGLPVNYSNNLSQAIRNEMFLNCKNVKTIVSTVNKPVQINPKSDIFQRQLRRTAEMYNQYKEVFDNLREDEQLTGTVSYDNHGRRTYVNADTLNLIKDLYDSYVYVFDKSTHNMEFTETYYFIQASGKSRRELRDYKKKLTNFLTGEGVAFVELKGNINQYLNNYCPATYEKEPIRKLQPMLLSQENLASITNYKSKGLVGDRGALIAQDRQTNLPYMQDFFHSGAAQVIMVMSKSGWGKTILMFNAALSILGYHDTHGSVIDIKGNEWNRILEYVDGQVIDMDKGAFVNSLRLDDLKIDKSESIEYFKLAVKDTVQFYKLIINLQIEEGNVRDLEDILNTAVMKMYYKNDVKAEELHSFSNTKNMKYADVIEILEDLTATASYTETQKNICRIAKTRLSSFFLSESGKGSEMTNEITIQSVLENPFTIYAFNKNSNTELDLLDSLRVFQVQILDNRVAMIRKRKGLFTVAFYEELQRCVHSSELINYISGRVTGSRSDNLIIFLILNAVSTFDESALKQIKSNITTYMIGKVEPTDAQKIVNDFDCRDIADYISCINESETEYYRNCFAVKFDTGYKVDNCIIKAILPPKMEKTLRTRDVLEDEE